MAATTATTPTVERTGRPPALLVRVVNPILTLLLRSPLHWLVSDSLLLLTVTGRATGARYTFPVNYEQDGGTLTVFSHGTNWWRNLRGGGQSVQVWLGGERQVGYATVTEDDTAVAEAVYQHLSWFEEGSTRRARQVGLKIDGDQVPTVEALEAAVADMVVVHIDLNVH